MSLGINVVPKYISIITFCDKDSNTLLNGFLNYLQLVLARMPVALTGYRAYIKQHQSQWGQ